VVKKIEKRWQNDKASGKRTTSLTTTLILSINYIWVRKVHQSHRNTCRISQEAARNSSVFAVYGIVRQNLKLKCLKKRHSKEFTVANCALHRTRTRKLLCRFPASAADFIFFTDEKIFTVAPPVNLQNDRVYVPTMTKKRELNDQL